MKLYHATTESNFEKIVENGQILPKGLEQCIFFADSSNSAALFLALRGEKLIYVIEVDSSSLDADKIHESFDHSQTFFQCRAYVYDDSISIDNICNVYKIKL